MHTSRERARRRPAVRFVGLMPRTRGDSSSWVPPPRTRLTGFSG